MTDWKGNFIAETTNQWRQLFGDYNWRDFDVICLNFEDDVALGGFEIRVALLGFAARFRWNHTDTPLTRRMAREIEEINRDSTS